MSRENSCSSERVHDWHLPRTARRAVRLGQEGVTGSVGGEAVR